MRPVLSILIPTIVDRRRSFERLVRLLSEQAAGLPVEILHDAGPEPTGVKRNRLLARAVGEYVAHFDDDDLPSDDYVVKVLAGCAEGKDCCSLEGVVIFDRRPPKRFHHSMVYPKWREIPERFERSPNHLNAVRRELALQASFPNETVGEDREFSRRLLPCLRSEAEVRGCLYFYACEPKVRARAAGLRFVLKWPTRGRQALFRETLTAHREALSGRNPVRFVVSVDKDDPADADIAAALSSILGLGVGCNPDWCITAGPAGRGKIAAINADIPTDEWDVLVLLADDMVPVEKDWDERIVIDMARTFPDLDGILAYDDGYRPPPVNPEEVSCITMPVMGRRYYDRAGFIYHPEYTSLWCDVELAEAAVRAGKAKRIPRVIIRHDWIGQRPDELLKRNESYYAADQKIYKRRQAAGFPRGRSDVYSQNDEEAIILAEFEGQPAQRLLDIGAYDGKTLSNSLRLIEMGWGGVLVEPAPGPFQALIKRHGGNSNLTLVNCALAAKPGFATFRDSRGDAVSTLSAEHAGVWSAAGVQWDSFLVRTVTPKELFAQIGYDFAFITLDVEGVNAEVFHGIPWVHLVRAGLRLVCVEHEGHDREMEAVLAPFGFERAGFNGENAIWRRRA